MAAPQVAPLKWMRGRECFGSASGVFVLKVGAMAIAARLWLREMGAVWECRVLEGTGVEGRSQRHHAERPRETVLKRGGDQ